MRKKGNRARRRQQTSEARREADKQVVLEEEERLLQKQAAARQRQSDPEGMQRAVQSPPREGDRARRRQSSQEYRNGQIYDYAAIQPIIQAAYDREQTTAELAQEQLQQHQNSSKSRRTVLSPEKLKFGRREINWSRLRRLRMLPRMYWTH